MKSSRAALLVAIAVAATSCATPPRRIDEVVPKQQLQPLSLLPQDAALYAKVLHPGWQQARTTFEPMIAATARLVPRTEGAEWVGPALLLLADPLLSRDLTAFGHDAVRPTYFAFLSADAEKLSRIVSLGAYVAPEDTPGGLLSVMLVPAQDAAKLKTHLSEWASSLVEAQESRSARFRVDALDGWVRVALFAGRNALEPEQVDAAFEAALARQPAKRLRLTPALADLVGSASAASLYAPLDNLRPVLAANGAIRLNDAVELVNPMDADLIRAVGSAELTQQWLFMDPSSAEFEDLVVHVDATANGSAELRTLSTLTDLGRKLASHRGEGRNLPAFKNEPSMLELNAAGDFAGARRTVPLPRAMSMIDFERGEERRQENLSTLFEIADWGAYPSVLRAPSAWLRVLERIEPGIWSGPRPLAMALKVLPLTARTFLRSGEYLRGGMVMQFATEAELDEFLVRLRSKRGEADEVELSTEKLPAGPGGAVYGFVGFNTRAAEMLSADGAMQTVPAGIAATVPNSILELVPRSLQRRNPLFALLSRGALRFEASTEATVARGRMSFGEVAATEAHAPVPSFDPVGYGGAAEACRFEVGAAMARAMEAVGYVNPKDRKAVISAALDDADTACVKGDPVLASELAVMRERFKALEARTEEQLKRFQEEDRGGDEAEAPVHKVERFKVPLRAGRAVTGPDSAKVTIVMVGDFQCPFCARADGTLKQVKAQYGDNVRFAFLNNPLSFHHQALPAARAALAAHKQGRFWEMKDRLFENQSRLTKEAFEEHARALKLNLKRFRRDLDSKETAKRLEEEQAFAVQMGGPSTPTFFINGRKLVGAQPLEKFQAIIDEELVAANALIAQGTPPDKVYDALIADGLEHGPRPPPPPVPAGPQAREPVEYFRVPLHPTMPQKGPADAKLTMVVVADFECPFSARLQPTLSELQEAYGKELRIVFVNNPLPFHRNARFAAKAAVAAHQQKKFWKLHDALFENQRELSEERTRALAKGAGLNMARFETAVAAPETEQQLENELTLALSVGATGTPTSFINGRQVVGALPLSMFKEIADEELKAADDALRAGVKRKDLYEHLLKRADEQRAPGQEPEQAALP